MSDETTNARTTDGAQRQADGQGTGPRGRRGPRPDRPKRRDVNGWLVLDKAIGVTSTQAVAMVKRAFNAKKAGHAGTLDPLASGILPIALGEATKTVPFVMDGRKAYLFTVSWGVETDTDDAEGRAVERSDARPSPAEIEAILPDFVGQIMQVPPRFSAIKIAGERAYDLARDGETVELVARPVEIDRISLVAHHGDTSVFEAECGRGTYVRALARDFGRRLGCLGHVSSLRRTRVGPFTEEDTVGAEDLEAFRAAVEAGESPALADLVLPVQTALGELESVPVSRDAAARLMRGQSVILRGRDAPVEGQAYATFGGILVSTGTIERGEFVPHRVFNLKA
ncbi:tRNA pseudouridine(55) synthase TruB [Salinarimonas rosea]|uniref:tRNA pseudouridine(55) synthase TruB n=1 Tax=Salinarimonas rosea TaxID=552063 RepID=UPI00048AD789|nr:tRNA pseudouridine(55) synthase TruB [Salinarimonas rosea]